MRIQDMTLRQLLNKNVVESDTEVSLSYDGCVVLFDDMWQLEAEAIEADFIDEEVKSYRVPRTGGLIINM